MQLLLFIIRVSEGSPNIKELFHIFLKEHIEMFQTSNKQYISTILFNILEELSLFKIFSIEDIKNLYDLALQKYIKVYEITKDATNKYIIENDHQKVDGIDSNSYLSSGKKSKSDVNYVFCDISEFKSSIISLFNTCYLLFYNYQNTSLVQMLYKVKISF